MLISVETVADRDNQKSKKNKVTIDDWECYTDSDAYKSGEVVTDESVYILGKPNADYDQWMKENNEGPYKKEIINVCDKWRNL